MGELFIFPMIDVLGIDQGGKSEMESASDWYGFKDFLKVKLIEMESVREQHQSRDGKSRLFAAMTEESANL